MKFNYKKTIKVGLAFAIIMVFWTTYDYVVPLLLENTFGLSNSMRGLIMGLDNLLSLFMLPLFGKISDKTVTRYGKRTPFIVIGTLISVALMIFVPVSSMKQLDSAMELRSQIISTEKADYVYVDHQNNEYSAAALYEMLYEKGHENSDYSDHQYLKINGIDSKDAYLKIALNRLDENGKITSDYNKFVESGIDNYASDQVYEKITKNNPGTIAVYMVILFFVLVAMATFRSPAVALMPDVTPKPLRSQANAMINLVGGAGGAIAFIIYTVVLKFAPTNYVLVFIMTAMSMLLILLAFLMLVKEKKLVEECELICTEYGVTDSDDEDTPVNETDTSIGAVKRARFRSFILILAAIFMWFMGYNAVTSNLSIYMTTSLNLEPSLGGLVSGISMGVSAIAFIPVGYLAVKIGRRKSIIIGFALAITSFVLIFLFAANPSSSVAIFFTLFYLLSGFGLIIANVNTFPMVVELSAKDTIGKYTGWYYTATMSAQAITPYIAGTVMDAFGNKFLFLYAPICVAVAIVFMALVKHGDSKPIPKQKKGEIKTQTADEI
ncbi:MAG: MFS transporter [Christensenellaceae bacterium]|nr:MFS transporter [Christensenellaceae bacterium]